MADPWRRRRDPVPEAPPEAPGGYLTLVQPALFWRAWEIEQEGTLLARIERRGWRRYRVESANGQEEARFADGTLRLGELAATAAAGGAVVGGARLAYRSEEVPYPMLADHEGPLLLVGDMRGAGFRAEGRMWAADRLLARGAEAVRVLGAVVLILRERPGSFR